MFCAQRVGSVGEPRKGSVGLGSLLAQDQAYFMIAPDVQFPRRRTEAALAIPDSK